MRTGLLLVSAALLLSFGSCIEPPIWALEWTSSFNETGVDLNNTNISGQTNGVLYYDFGRNRQRIDRDNGRYDRLCGTEMKDVDTPCSQITVNNALWLVFTEQQQCCECCTNAGGCAVVSNTWLSRAVYQGTQTIAGYDADVWYEQGAGDNYYYDTTVGSFPVALYMPGVDYLQFDPQTYTTKSIEDSLFVLPGYCSGKCTNSWVCNALR